MPLDLGFGGLVICVRAVETHPSGIAGLVNVGAQHVPPLAQVQHSVMSLGRPALWCDPYALSLGHLTSPVEVFSLASRLTVIGDGYLSWVLHSDLGRVW
jgi:hypothetical protein